MYEHKPERGAPRNALNVWQGDGYEIEKIAAEAADLYIDPTRRKFAASKLSISSFWKLTRYSSLSLSSCSPVEERPGGFQQPSGVGFAKLARHRRLTRPALPVT
jgi:hypothetical protein